MHTIAASVYDTIFARRDVRGEFTGEPADPVILHRILSAAHAAPSVGLSQPWDFILVEDRAICHDFWVHVDGERRVFSAALPAERAAVFDRIRIEGILEASVSLVVTYDPDRGAPHVLGRHAIAEAGLYSVCLTIENLGLAATARGGVSGGSRSIGSVSSTSCSRCLRGSGRLHGCVSGRSHTTRRFPTLSVTAGAVGCRCRRSFTTTGGSAESLLGAVASNSAVDR